MDLCAFYNMYFGEERSMAQLKGLIAIGSSTGGPRALQHILSQFPADFPAAFFIVQHMPSKFTGPFAERLDGLCALKVVEARHHDPVKPGTVYIAPGNRHMTVRQTGLHLHTALDDAEAVSGHRPSVDRLFLSLKNVSNVPMTLIVLTGMGKDGSHGIQQVKQINPAVTTLAEEESSCIVFGMPKAAIATGCVDKVAPLAAIADKVKHIVKTWETEGGSEGE